MSNLAIRKPLSMTKEASKVSRTASYDQRWLILWRDAYNNAVRLDFPTRASATTQRHAMYRLRQEMIDEGHPFAEVALRCKISGPVPTEDNPNGETFKGHFLIVRAKETREGLDALEKAGYVDRPAPSLGD